MKVSLLITCSVAVCLAGCAGTSQDNGIGSFLPEVTVFAGGGTKANQLGTEAAATLAVDPRDANFMREAAECGLADVQRAQLAMAHADNPNLRKFGQMLVQEHDLANAQLKQLAADKHVPLPTQPNAEQQQMLNHLASLRGTDFNQAFEKQLLEAHEESILAFQNEANETQDLQLSNFAEDTLPILQRHLAQVQSLEPSQATAEQNHSQQP